MCDSLVIIINQIIDKLELIYLKLLDISKIHI